MKTPKLSATAAPALIALCMGMIFALSIPSRLEARCLDLAGSWRMAKSAAAPVFGGAVLEVRKVPGGQIARIEVDRVWRGEVPHVLTFYNFTGGVSDAGQELALSTARTLTAGERYISFTHEQSLEERRLFGIEAGARTYGTRGCGIWPHNAENDRALGKSRKVKRPKVAWGAQHPPAVSLIVARLHTLYLTPGPAGLRQVEMRGEVLAGVVDLVETVG